MREAPGFRSGRVPGGRPVSPGACSRAAHGRRGGVHSGGKELYRRAPTLEAAVWSWLDQFGQGKLVVKVDTSDLGRQLDLLNAAGRRLSTEMIVVGQLIGTAIRAVVAVQPAIAATLGFIPGLAITAFLVTPGYSFYFLLRSEAGGGGSDDPR